MSDRKQLVRVDKCLSEPSTVISGVPQGTILGPVLFLCYTLDIVKVVKHCTLSIYADDTKMYMPIKNIDDCVKLQSDLDRISSWSRVWQLLLNVKKTHLLTIGKRRHLFDYSLYGSNIKLEKSVTDLGIVMQSDLIFQKHCSVVVGRAYFTLRKKYFQYFQRS